LSRGSQDSNFENQLAAKAGGKRGKGAAAGKKGLSKTGAAASKASLGLASALSEAPKTIANLEFFKEKFTGPEKAAEQIAVKGGVNLEIKNISKPGGDFKPLKNQISRSEFNTKFAVTYD